MRIAIFAWESIHSISVGGIAIHVTELACALERKGQEVHVFTRMGREDHPAYERIHGVHYHRCPYASSQNFIEEVHNMCRSLVNAFFATENYIGPFDVIHAHDWLTSNAVLWIKQVQSIRTIFTIHSTEYGRCGNNFWEGQSAVIRQQERQATQGVDKVIAVSKALRNEINWMYNTPEEKTSVVYNGVNPWTYGGWVDAGAIRRLYGIGPMDPTILFVGRMVYQKGPDLLVEAIPCILRYYNNAKFVFVGEGGMRWSVQDRAREIGVEDACRFLGWQDGWRLTDLYKSVDVVCVPSRNEPFGIVILEAWSSGKPVVTTSVGGPNEIVWHDVTGLKINPHPESVAWGIGTCLEDFDHCQWMGANGRTAVETAFSWDVIADHVLDVYTT